MTMNNMNHTEKLPIIDPQDPGYANYPDGVTTDVPKFQSSPTSIPVPEPEPVRAPQPPSSSGPQDPKKKPKKGVFRGNMTPAYIILTILSIAMNVLLVYVLFHTTRFSALGTDKFILINIVALAVLLLIDILVFVAIRSKKIWAFIISCLCLVLAVGGGLQHPGSQTSRCFSFWLCPFYTFRRHPLPPQTRP